jgi:hypothetical protein
VARIRALIKREMKETYLKRKAGLVIQFVVGMVVVPTAFYPIYVGVNRAGGSPGARSVMFGIFPVFIVVALGVPFLIEHFYKDKMKRNTELLLALGFTPFQIWISKVTALAVFAGSCYEIAIVFSLVTFQMFTQTGVGFSLGPARMLNLFLLSPLLGMSLLGIKGLLHFLFKDIRLLNILFILPFVLLFMFFRSAMIFLRVTTIDDIGFSAVLLVVAVCFFSVSYLVLRTLPKERWL